MQARLQINRFPRLLAIVLFALTSAMVLGGALGHTLKASGASPAASHSIVQQDATGGADPNTHISGWVESHKPYQDATGAADPNTHISGWVESHKPY